MRSGAFVFFDLGGTLVELSGLLSAAARVIERDLELQSMYARKMAADWAAKTTLRIPWYQGRRFLPEKLIAARTLRETFRGEGISTSDELASRVVRESWRIFINRAELRHGVTIAQLRRVRNISSSLGIVTDGDSRETRNLLVQLGLARLFTSVTISEEVRAYKPNRRIYGAALSSLKAEPSQSLFVSESLLDLIGASALGMATAYIRRARVPSVEKSRAPHAHTFEVRGVRGLDKILTAFSRTGRFNSILKNPQVG